MFCPQDWANFSAPSLVFDPACTPASYAPYNYSEGGIDGDITFNPTDQKYYLVYKDGRSPAPTDVHTLQHTSGARVSVSEDLVHWSKETPAVGFFGGVWGLEGPEVLVVNNTEMRLYFDCAWQPIPQGYPHGGPPFGVATAPYPDGYTNPNAWTTVEGSCTQWPDSPAAKVAFPGGASQGSVVCLDEAEYSALAKFAT